MEYRFKVNSLRQGVHKFFDLMNAVNPDSNSLLTKGEIELLTEFLLLPSKFRYQRFSSLAKDKVIESLKQELDYSITKVNLNNKLYSILDKGYLRRDEDSVLYISDFVLKGVDELIKSISEGKDYEIPFVFQLSKDH